jgi:Ni/Fe-hydrogenase subunit HybB-like protein
MLAKIANIMMWVIIGYLVLRFLDLLVRGQVGLIFQGDLNSFMFILENALYVAPVILMAIPAHRSNLRWLFVAALSMLLAGSLYRFNAFLIGFNPGPGWRYFPALPEIFITLGIVAFELMAYLYLVKRFPVLPKVEHV